MQSFSLNKKQTKNIAPPSPTMQLGHWGTTVEEMYQITCSFFWRLKRHSSTFFTDSVVLPKTCKHTVMCGIGYTLNKRSWGNPLTQIKIPYRTETTISLLSTKLKDVLTWLTKKKKKKKQIWVQHFNWFSVLCFFLCYTFYNLPWCLTTFIDLICAYA